MLVEAIVCVLKENNEEHPGLSSNQFSPYKDLSTVLNLFLRSAHKYRQWLNEAICWRNPDHFATLLDVMLMDHILLTAAAMVEDRAETGDTKHTGYMAAEGETKMPVNDTHITMNQEEISVLYQELSSRSAHTRLKTLINLATYVKSSTDLSSETVEELNACVVALEHRLNYTLDTTDPSTAICATAPGFTYRLLYAGIASYRRTAFLYQDRLVGLGTNRLRDGDTLVRFQDRAPIFVLRPMRDMTYKLIGEAFVPGLDWEGNQAPMTKLRIC
jgi:hypothetical protein